MDKNESRASGNPEEKKVTVVKPPVKQMDLVDQVWERFTKSRGAYPALSWNEGFKVQDADPGLKVQDLYCAILLLYNDINKTLRPGPHHDPPTRKEVQKYLKTHERINEDTTLDREEFNAFFEMFTNNVIRRDELQSFFTTGANQQFVRSGSHTEQEFESKSAANCSSQEPPGPSRNLKTEEESEDLYKKRSKDVKNSDCEDLKAPNGSWNVLRHGRTDSAVHLNSFSGGSHFQIFNFANADMDSLATFVKQIRK